jgi:hypothetical protein
MVGSEGKMIASSSLRDALVVPEMGHGWLKRQFCYLAFIRRSGYFMNRSRFDLDYNMNVLEEVLDGERVRAAINTEIAEVNPITT